MNSRLRLLLLAAAWAPAAFAQLQLTQVVAGVERPVGAVFSFGSIDAGDSVGASFRLRNTGAAPIPLTPIAVLGTAFLWVAPPTPASLSPQAALDFAVSFQPSTPGSYSATLAASGTTVLLTGVAAPALTWQVITASGMQPLNPPVDFGNVMLGSSSTLRFTVVNQTAQAMVVPAIAVSGTDFRLDGDSPSGTLLPPLASGVFAVVFTPGAATQRNGGLAAGSHSYALTGTGQAPPLPKPFMSIDVASPTSGQQGSLAVTFDSASTVTASGAVTMSFSPGAGVPAGSAVDPAMGFSSGGLTAPFTVAAGDNRAHFGAESSAAFATGTTAGTITFTIVFGNSTSQQSITILPAAVGLTSVQATRQAGSITAEVTGFDNTRSAGRISFTFYDAAGIAITPGTISVDSSAAFANYFRSAGLGGAFSLTAVFPVTGNISQIAALDLEMPNSAGTARSARIVF